MPIVLDRSTFTTCDLTKSPPTCLQCDGRGASEIFTYELASPVDYGTLEKNTVLCRFAKNSSFHKDKLFGSSLVALALIPLFYVC